MPILINKGHMLWGNRPVHTFLLILVWQPLSASQQQKCTAVSASLVPTSWTTLLVFLALSQKQGFSSFPLSPNPNVWPVENSSLCPIKVYFFLSFKHTLFLLQSSGKTLNSCALSSPQPSLRSFKTGFILLCLMSHAVLSSQAKHPQPLSLLLCIGILHDFLQMWYSEVDALF